MKLSRFLKGRFLKGKAALSLFTSFHFLPFPSCPLSSFLSPLFSHIQLTSTFHPSLSFQTLQALYLSDFSYGPCRPVAS